MDQHEEAEIILQNMQFALKVAGHWSQNEMSVEALHSQQPFCCDTMNFSEWMQFVFIPKMQVLIQEGQKLPILSKGQGIEPMASECYSKTRADQKIMVLIRQFDELLQQG